MTGPVERAMCKWINESGPENAGRSPKEAPDLLAMAQRLDMQLAEHPPESAMFDGNGGRTWYYELHLWWPVGDNDPHWCLRMAWSPNDAPDDSFVASVAWDGHLRHTTMQKAGDWAAFVRAATIEERAALPGSSTHLLPAVWRAGRSTCTLL